jgi:protocatechuate 3,4-dioxygenase beta subunit
MTSIYRRRLVGAALLLPVTHGAWAELCAKPTARQTEGPFFKPESPQRVTFLEAGSRGPRLVISGRVLGADCRPAPNALLDFWHADESGDYDNRGFRYRGHQFADREGRWRLETIVPAVYPGRTRHIHVKVQPPGGRILTTQLYFPGEPENERDGLFRRELVMRMPERGQGNFDFVVA